MSDSRRARVNRTATGDPLGVTIALSASELQELGINPDDIDEIEYHVTDGSLQIEEPLEKLLVQ